MPDIAIRSTEIAVDDFENFWRAYPRRTGKGVARKAFVKAIQKTTITIMLTALNWQRQQSQWLKDGGTFIPHPATWLNQERWDDEPCVMPTLSAGSVRMMQTMMMTRTRRDERH